MGGGSYCFQEMKRTGLFGGFIFGGRFGNNTNSTMMMRRCAHSMVFPKRSLPTLPLAQPLRAALQIRWFARPPNLQMQAWWRPNHQISHFQGACFVLIPPLQTKSNHWLTLHYSETLVRDQQLCRPPNGRRFLRFQPRPIYHHPSAQSFAQQCGRFSASFQSSAL